MIAHLVLLCLCVKGVFLTGSLSLSLNSNTSFVQWIFVHSKMVY